jgi:hypothetical protein
MDRTRSRDREEREERCAREELYEREAYRREYSYEEENCFRREESYEKEGRYGRNDRPQRYDDSLDGRRGRHRPHRHLRDRSQETSLRYYDRDDHWEPNHDLYRPKYHSRDRSLSTRYNNNLVNPPQNWAHADPFRHAVQNPRPKDSTSFIKRETSNDTAIYSDHGNDRLPPPRIIVNDQPEVGQIRPEENESDSSTLDDAIAYLNAKRLEKAKCALLEMAGCNVEEPEGNEAETIATSKEQEEDLLVEEAARGLFEKQKKEFLSYAKTKEQEEAAYQKRTKDFKDYAIRQGLEFLAAREEEDSRLERAISIKRKGKREQARMFA